MKKYLFLFVFGFGLAGVVVIAFNKREAVVRLPIISSIPAVSMTDASGASFDQTFFREKFTVVNFFFTRCQGPCPMLMQKVRQLQNNFATEPRIHFASISSDPGHDDPGVLASYAEKLGANARQWFFLNASKWDLKQLAEEGFKLAWNDDSGLHSTRLFLIDDQGKYRASYDSESAQEIEQLKSILTKWVRK